MARGTKVGSDTSKKTLPSPNILIQSEQEYTKQLPVLEALRSEVEYIVKQAMDESEIKIHEIESRIKTYNSIERKISNASTEKGSNGLVDIVGLRIICLFRSDLSRILSILDNEFDVISSDDKIDIQSDAFGYMSIHYVCSLKDDVKGRRYDAIKGKIFEIQVRTLCMHAWAAISHYLDYKAEWDIPASLKKDLNALSALFYLADTQYEQIFNARDASRAEISLDASQHIAGTVAINLDTLYEFLKNKYPERAIDRSGVSSLTGELLDAGITDIGMLEKELNSSVDAFKKEESARAEGPFAAVGVVRISLRKSHPGYSMVYNNKNKVVRLTYSATARARSLDASLDVVAKGATRLPAPRARRHPSYDGRGVLRVHAPSHAPAPQPPYTARSRFP